MSVVNFIHCYKICGANYKYCRDRQKKISCKKLREVLTSESRRRILERANDHYAKQYSSNISDGDFYDSIGNDISKDEFLENEIWHATNEE